MNVEQNLLALVRQFEVEQEALFDKEPEIFEGYSTRVEWNAQVAKAGAALKAKLQTAFDSVETELHDGGYHA